MSIAMRKRRGFLLIELMFCLLALSFMLCLFGQFFSSIICWHKQARDRLDMLLVLQNHTEKIWQNSLKQRIKRSNDQMAITYRQLPLPRIEDNLIIPELKYGTIECRASQGSVVVELPGYMYDAI